MHVPVNQHLQLSILCFGQPNSAALHLVRLQYPSLKRDQECYQMHSKRMNIHTTHTHHFQKQQIHFFYYCNIGVALKAEDEERVILVYPVLHTCTPS